MAINVEAEIRDLKRRVSELEGSFGFLSQQIKGVHKDLLAFQAKTELEFTRVNGRLDRIEKEGRDLRKDLPGMLSSAVREGLRERRQSRKQP